MAKIELSPIGNFNNIGLNTINANWEKLEEAVDRLLSRNGQAPNQMEADLDMNHNDILNVETVYADHVIVDGAELKLMTWVVGTGAPLPSLGDFGDFYLDALSGDVYGPKTSVWGGPVANIQGPKGDKGDKGDQGDVGPAGTITGATATGLVAGAAPTVTLGGTPQARTFAFGIPKGDKGDKGDTGAAATIAAGTTATGAAGTTASVTNVGTSGAAIFNFTIPRGDKGDKGDKGDQGDVGPKGDKGDPGSEGWTPVFAVVADGNRYVQQVVDWTGGTGTKPTTGQYVGTSGFVSAIGDAVNIRGASGSGAGDVNGPPGATDGEMVLFDGASGKLIKGGGLPFSGNYNDLSNKPDLSGFATTAQLSGKFDNPAGTTSQYIRGDGSLATFPAIPAGTVTSVGLSAPTGFTVSGSPVTGSGTLTLAYAPGYTGFTTALQTKLNGIEAGAQVNTVTSVAGKTGAVTLAKGDVGLSNVDNTSDANKPVSSAQAAAINAKVTKANDTGLGGFTATSKALPASGTINLAPTDGNIQHCAKTEAVTMNAPTAAGVYTIIVEVHNTNATGTVTLSGFTKTDGDAFTTTSGDKFHVHIAKTNSAVTATVKALQ